MSRPLNVEAVLALIGASLTIVLLVLDKAGKLKGGTLIALIILAGLFMVPLAVGNPWVLNAATGAWKIWRGALLISLIGFVYSAISIWVASPDSPTITPPADPKSVPDRGYSSSGLATRDVPAKDLGILKPTYMVVDFGNNKSHIPTSLLKHDVPFEDISGIEILDSGDKPATIPIGVSFDEAGDLVVDATVYDQNLNVGAKLEGNKLATVNRGWDRNRDKNALEVINEYGAVVLQFNRVSDTDLRIRGLFRLSNGQWTLSSDDGYIGLGRENLVQIQQGKRINLGTSDHPRMVGLPEPLFQYPSTKHYGVRHKR